MIDLIHTVFEVKQAIESWFLNTLETVLDWLERKYYIVCRYAKSW